MLHMQKTVRNILTFIYSAKSSWETISIYSWMDFKYAAPTRGIFEFVTKSSFNGNSHATTTSWISMCCSSVVSCSCVNINLFVWRMLFRIFQESVFPTITLSFFSTVWMRVLFIDWVLFCVLLTVCAIKLVRMVHFHYELRLVKSSQEMTKDRKDKRRRSEVIIVSMGI